MPGAGRRDVGAPADRLPAAPDDLVREVWNVGALTYKQSAGRTFVFGTQPPAGPGTTMQAGTGLDVPLELWNNITWPGGLPIGGTNGVSWGDFDRDGWVDLYSNQSGLLWRNLGGTNWTLGADTNALLGPALIRYGASFADYDEDGLPDLATEPRNVGVGLDRCFHLLRNLGGGLFEDVSTDPAIVDANRCNLDSETIGWVDVDGDADLDMFLPVYPAWAVFPGPGNLFLRNNGRNASGEFTFTDATVGSGLGNPPNTARPEGAQFCDYDRDGDPDLFSNGTLYQNASTLGVPLFSDVSDSSGIQFRDALDEGVLFFDYDLDGDEDLLIAYESASVGNRLYRNRGDGRFELTPPGTIVNWFTGVGLGLSAADWDNDGDIDITTRQVFRRNLLMESGTATFIPATHGIDLSHLTSATPAWADWDKDGDLDTAIGNWLEDGHLYDNELYTSSTPAAAKRHVRIQVVRDSDLTSSGLRTEFGAAVELRVLGDELSGIVRRKFVASGHGYLNQDDYVLHFALPDDPFPGNPFEDVRFDVVVDFPGLPGQGLWRVDKHVNPSLGNLNLSSLGSREITVFRSGKVVRNGFLSAPGMDVWPPLATTNGGGLQLTQPATPLSPLTASPQPDWWVGVHISTVSAVEPVEVREIVLDARLDAAVDCGGTEQNLSVWDVTIAGAPELVTDGMFAAVTSDSNDRSYIPVDFTLQPGRRYRVAARVVAARHVSRHADATSAAVRVLGGLAFADATPCDGVQVAAAIPDAGTVPLALRYATPAPTAFFDLGQALAGTLGPPQRTRTGSLAPSTPLSMTLTGALPSAPSLLVLGLVPLQAPLLGGVLVPDPFLIVPLTLPVSGSMTLAATWPTGVPQGFQFWLQWWVIDAGGPQGYAASNGLRAKTP